MKFTKMHGCGNDYIYVNGFRERIPTEEKPALVRYLSDRHFGVGGDGVIFINSSARADFEMEMYNADGSRAEMCGNGIRCVAKYVYDKGLTDALMLTVESAGRVKSLELSVEERTPQARGHVTGVCVNMGSPILKPALIPVEAVGERVVNEEIWAAGRKYRMTCVSMGNPHAVIFTENVAQMDLGRIGPCFENHQRFPQRVNTEFVEIADRRHAFMRVWERGTGETLACGTGCCAVVVAGVLNDLTEREITVKLLGGELSVRWDEEQNQVFLKGPAEAVFEGEL